MKDYIVTSEIMNGGKFVYFDRMIDAMDEATKRQKTRKYDMIVLKKIEENADKTVYVQCFNARFHTLTHTKYVYLRKYGF